MTDYSKLYDLIQNYDYEILCLKTIADCVSVIAFCKKIYSVVIFYASIKVLSLVTFSFLSLLYALYASHLRPHSSKHSNI